jgi:hypothetical protein
MDLLLSRPIVTWLVAAFADVVTAQLARRWDRAAQRA